MVFAFRALDRGKFGKVIKNSENVLHTVKAWRGIGSSDVREQEFQDAGGWRVQAGGGGESLGVRHDTGFAESVRVVLGLLELKSHSGKSTNHILADEEIHVPQAKIT
jgi:hypothetical protein